MRTRVFFFAVASALAGVAFAVAVSPRLAHAQHAGTIYTGFPDRFSFADDFDGAALDPMKWNLSIATAGNRWCSLVGLWFDPSSMTCGGQSEVPPFGGVTVGGGAASFASGFVRCFPYVWCGPPSRPSPFPRTGDFSLAVRMRFDSINTHGCGLVAMYWPDTDPIGSSLPPPAQGLLFQLWSGSSGTEYWAYLLGQEVPIADWASFHTFEVVCASGAYSLYVDQTIAIGPIVSTLRPNTIYLGNPLFTWWGVYDWSDFTMDFIRVRAL